MSGGGLRAGAVIGEVYRLVRLLGEGGMGYVWEATHVSTWERVALKVLKGEKDEDRRRFLREVRAAAAIHHPNVIKVHDFIELPKGALVIVMDLLEGETLGAILRRDKRISLPDLAALMLPVVAALDAAHEMGIVHRDLKPDNIFVCAGGKDLTVKVLDFGVAKLTATDGLAARTQALTGTGSMVGTPYYMSPEQVFADKDLDARSDIWSLGIVMYECLSGVRPTEADTVGRVLKRIMIADFEPVTAHCDDLPKDVIALLARMLSPERENRPQNLAEIKEVLERHKSQEPPSFSRAVASPVDPTANTVPTPDDAPNPSTTRAERAAMSPRVRDVVVEKAVEKANTNDPVLMGGAQPSRARSRVIAAAAGITFAIIAGAIALRGSGELGGTANGNPSSIPASAPSAPSAPSELPRPIAKEAPSAAEPATTPQPSVEPSSSPVATADANANANAAANAAKPPPARPAPNARPDATAPAAAASCEAREVMTNGHCCPRGLVWQFGRCERPFATSF